MSGIIVLLLFAAIFWVAPIVVAKKIGDGKMRPNAWVWGLLLGWLGVLIVALLGPGRPQMYLPVNVPASMPQSAVKTCPDCAEDVSESDAVCRFCGYRFTSAVSAPMTTRPGTQMAPVEPKRRVVIEPD